MSDSTQSLKDSLLDKYGPLIGGVHLRQSLGYPSTSAFTRAVRKGTVGINVFKIPGRRGTFALTFDVAEWLSSTATAEMKHRTSIKTLKAAYILDRVEVDHTPMDVIVIDTLTKLPCGRPWLTLAIDKKSRMITGFYISFHAPSSFSVMQCLKRAVLDHMAYDNPTPLSLLERPIEQWLRLGDGQALKTALVNYGLLDGFADYLINLFADNVRSIELATAMHGLVELVHEFSGNLEQQQAVLALLPHARP